MAFELAAPEVATIVRWVLRVVLVAFLAWLVKGRQEEPEEEEQEDEAEVDWQKQRQQPQYRGRQPPNDRGRKFEQRRDHPYQTRERNNQSGDMRQRRPAGSSDADFDAVISKMSKPKTMWENKGGSAPQIVKRDSGADVGEADPPHRQDRTARAQSPDRVKRLSSHQEATSSVKKPMLHAHERPVTWLAWNRDGNLLFTCGKDKKVCVWSFPDGEQLGSYDGHNGAVWACSVNSDSSWLVTGGADQNVIVWEAKESRELARTELPGSCRFVEWASSGSSGKERFVTVHNKFGRNPPAITVFQFDGSAIEQQLCIDQLPGSATQVRWGQGDRFIASAHENGELVFWQADTGAEVRRLKVHDTPISKFDFSSDRKILATVSTDKKVKVWDLGEEGTGDGKLLFETETDRPLNAVSLGPLTRAAVVSADAKPGCCTVIAAGGQDVRDVALSSSTSEQFDTLLFKSNAGKLEAIKGSTKGHFGPVHTLAITADGSAMASGSEDGCVRLHLF